MPPVRARLSGPTDLAHEREEPKVGIQAASRGPLPSLANEVVDQHLRRRLTVPVDAAVADADALVLVTAHGAFRNVRPAEMVALMRTPRLVDTRNFFDAPEWENCGFACYQLGRPLRRVPVRPDDIVGLPGGGAGAADVPHR